MVICIALIFAASSCLSITKCSLLQQGGGPDDQQRPDFVDIANQEEIKKTSFLVSAGCRPPTD